MLVQFHDHGPIIAASDRQGAVIDRGLAVRDLRAGRIDIAVGAILTQVVTGAGSWPSTLSF
ncbi:MAG TPA: hypothetical protein VF327_08315 [Gaiellaceae bacterium]